MAGRSIRARLRLSGRTALGGRALRQHRADDRVGPDAPSGLPSEARRAPRQGTGSAVPIEPRETQASAHYLRVPDHGGVR